MANERVSDERLAEMLSRVSPPADGWSAGLPTMDVASIITELQALRSPHQGEVEAVVRRVMNSPPDHWESVVGDPGRRPYDVGWDAACKSILSALQPSVPKAGEDLFENHQWPLGTRVRKTKGASWQGVIVGYYSTELTPVGYAVESEREPGSVQIYPQAALEVCP